MKAPAHSKKPTLATVTSTLMDIVSVLLGVKEQVGSLEKQVGSLERQVGSLGKQVSSLEKKVDVRFDEVNDQLASVEDSVEFLKENSVTRDEFEASLRRVEEKIVDHVDHFVKLHKKQETELAAVAHSVVRHEQTFHGSQAAA